MSNRNKKMKKNYMLTGKKAGFLAVAAMSAVLVGGQVSAGAASAGAAQEASVSSMIPDNITIDKPVQLADISLPGNEYGSLEWLDGSYVPSNRVESCKVILKPAEGQDLSQVQGWDSEAGGVIGYINVIVNDPEEDGDDVKDNSADNQTEPTVTPENIQPTQMPDSETDKEDNKNNNKKEEDQKQDKEELKDGQKDEVSPAEKTDTELSVTPEPEESEAPDKEGEETEEETEKSEEIEGELEPEETPAEDEKTEDNIFDNPVKPDQEDDRPAEAEENLTEEEKEARAQMNHTCDGITVSGIDLPWYVQFRVSSGDSYQFTNETDAMIFQSFEFELWDLQNNTEYEIPNGEYISVTVPVKAGYEYTIEHLLDNGATESIIPTVENDTMVFSTHSFSPFGIAGSKQLVGPDDSGDTDVTPAADSTVTVTPSAQKTETSAQNSDNAGAVSENSNGNAASDEKQADSNSSKSDHAVETGDTTTIMPFVVLIAAAAVIIGAVVFLKKKKK